MDAYCGKNCENCNFKENLACPGCKDGPGKFFNGDCEIAKCCGRKDYINCDACTGKSDCMTLQNRAKIPEWRYSNMTAEADKKVDMANKAPIIGKWLWLCFWLVIPSTITDIISNEEIVPMFPELDMPGTILSCLCVGLYGYFLLKLSSEEKHYRISGICYLVVTAFNVVIALLPNNDRILLLASSLAILSAIISLFGEYHEYMGHTEILIGYNNGMSNNWNQLWKWYIGTLACTFGSIIVVIINPILGMLVMLAGLIALIVVSIIKLVYLYKTAKIFREYS